MTINGVEFDIDFTDADFIEQLDKKSNEVYEKAEQFKQNINDVSPAEGIRQECKIIKDFLDYVLGDGASKKIFGDKNSLRDCLQAFKDIINERNRQFNDFKEIINEYSPDRLNR